MELAHPAIGSPARRRTGRRRLGRSFDGGIVAPRTPDSCDERHTGRAEALPTGLCGESRTPAAGRCAANVEALPARIPVVPNPDRLTGLDSSFLHLEGGAAHMHVGACAVFEGSPPRMKT